MNKKRLLFRLFFTLLFSFATVVLCRPVLLLPTPIEVSFSAAAERPIEFIVFWKKDKDEKFSAKLSQRVRMQHAKEALHFRIPANEICSFRIDPEHADGSVSIQNIVLRSGKNILPIPPDKALTTKNLGEIKKQGNAISLVCNQRDPQLIYKRDFKAQGKTADVTLTAIVIILSLCLYSYLSGIVLSTRRNLQKTNTAWYAWGVIPTRFFRHNRKKEGNFLKMVYNVFTTKQAWYNILFCCVFFVMLALPTINFNPEKVSRYERRPLNTFPVLSKQYSGINPHYGADFNNWLQDHSGYKEALIYQRARLSALLNNGCRENGSAILYADQWAFYKPYYTAPAPDAAREQRITENLQKLHRFCTDRGIRLYIVVCPTKEILYSERNRKARTLPAANFRSLAQRMAENHPEIAIIHPIQEMEAAKATHPELPLHYLLDTHANEDGNRIIYDALYKRMLADLPDLPQIPESFDCTWSPKRYIFEMKNGKNKGYFGGDLDTLLMLASNEAKNTKYRHYTYTGTGLKVKEGTENSSIVSVFSHGKHSAYILGDSSSQYLRFWAQFSFRDLWRYRVNNGPNKKFNMKRWEKELEQKRPDALIICVSEGTFCEHLSNLY